MLEDQVLPTFVNRTADEIIWGYDDPLTKMGREFSEGLKSDQFGLMAGTNYTFYGRFRQSYRYQVLTINSNVITLHCKYVQGNYSEITFKNCNFEKLQFFYC